MSYSKKLTLLLAFCLAALGRYTYGQVPQGQVLGVVMDSAGGTVPGASIQLENVLTGIRETMATDETGVFAFPRLNSGVYRLTVEKQGFKTGIYPEIQVQVGEKKRVDVQLQLGEVEVKVEVAGAVSRLDTDTSVVGVLLSRREVVELPLNGRDFSGLATLQPGVSFAGTQGSSIQAQFGTFVQVGGTSLVGAGYSIDGVDNRSQSWGGPAMNPSIDSIQEFKIEKNGSAAEFGRGGTQLMLVTKTGTNQFHGALWDYNRNFAMNAGNYYTHQNDGLIRNQYGANLGGPILKNKLFFYFNWEGQRQQANYQGQDTVMTDKMRTGDFSELLPSKVVNDPITGQPFPNNVIPADRINPAMTEMLKLMFRATRPGIVNNLITSVPTSRRSNQYGPRVDYKVTDKDSVFFRGSIESRKGGLSAPLYPQWMNVVEDYTFSNIGVGYTRVWNSSIVSETRFGWKRERTAQVNNGPKDVPVDMIKGFGPEPIDHYPIVFLDNFGSFGQGGNNVVFDSKDYEIAQNVSFARGKHLLKVGFDGLHNSLAVPEQYTHTSWPFLFFSDNVYSGLAAADLLLGLPNYGFIYGELVPKTVSLGNYAFFAQDDWKVTPSLTLNLGLRYELPTQQREKNNIWGNFDPKSRKVILAGDRIQTELVPDFLLGQMDYYVPASQTQFPIHTLVYPDRNNFAPRFGFAWRPFKNNKTVVRGGYGIHYIRPFGQQSASSFTPPYLTTFLVFNTKPTPTLTGDDFFSGGPTGDVGPPYAYYRDANLRDGYSQQLNVGIQHELPWGMTGEINFQDQNSVHLENYWDINQPRMGSGSIDSRRPYPEYSGFSSVFGSGHARYNAMEVLLRKSSQYYTFQFSYLWAKNMAEDFIDIYDRHQFDGPSNYVPSEAKLHFVMELPFGKGRRWLDHGGVINNLIGGWTLSGISTLYSGGRPFTIGYSGDTANINVYGVRANRTCNGNLSNPTVEKWFDTSCFTAPTPGTVGNAGTGILSGPSSFTADFGIYKRFTLHENINLQFRTEMFNVFNHPNLGSPNTTLNGFAFGQISNISHVPRVIQLALRLTF